VEKEFLALLPLIDSALFTSANDQLGLAYPHIFFFNGLTQEIGE
jgi:hypothetical protein